eukprot:5493503-Pyramimonas_sp.AAC.1
MSHQTLSYINELHVASYPKKTGSTGGAPAAVRSVPGAVRLRDCVTVFEWGLVRSPVVHVLEEAGLELGGGGQEQIRGQLRVQRRRLRQRAELVRQKRLAGRLPRGELTQVLLDLLRQLEPLRHHLRPDALVQLEKASETSKR